MYTMGCSKFVCASDVGEKLKENECVASTKDNTFILANCPAGEVCDVGTYPVPGYNNTCIQETPKIYKSYPGEYCA
jgi:hypothetical protein